MNTLSSIKKLIFLLFLVMQLTEVRASDQNVSAQILSLLEQNNTSQAYQLALENQAEYEGDPAFDYAFGSAARANGHLNQAIFAFERVLQVQPSAIDARLALATSYYELGNLDAAEKELKSLGNFELNSPALEEKIESFLNAIANNRAQLNNRLKAYIRSGMGHDSNPNNGVEDEFITIPALGPVTLFAESLENESVFVDLYGQLAYVRPINQHSSWRLAGSVLHAEYDDDLALSRTFVTTSFGYSTRFKNFDLNAAVFYRPLWLDGDSLLDYYGLNLTASKKLHGAYKVGLDLSTSFEDYASFRGFDRDQMLANGWLEISQSTSLHRFALRVGREQASDEGEFLDRNLAGIGYEWRQSVDQHWEYGLSLDYLDSDYQDVHPLFAQTRKDRFVSEIGRASCRERVCMFV